MDAQLAPTLETPETILAHHLDRTAHNGRRVRLTRIGGVVRTGLLSWGTNPSFRNLEHWYLLVPTSLPQTFGKDAHDALSLQWIGTRTVVEFLPEDPAA